MMKPLKSINRQIVQTLTKIKFLITPCHPLTVYVQDNHDIASMTESLIRLKLIFTFPNSLPRSVAIFFLSRWAQRLVPNGLKSTRYLHSLSEQECRSWIFMQPVCPLESSVAPAIVKSGCLSTQSQWSRDA